MDKIVNEPKRHHYVPRFLLRKWQTPDARGQLRLRGHHWHRWRKQAAVYSVGSNGVCCGEELFSLSNGAPDRARIERYFQGVDDRGATAAHTILAEGVDALDTERREHFADLLVSLDTRRPDVIAAIRERGERFLRRRLDNADALKREMLTRGFTGSPAEFYELRTGELLADRALTMLQTFAANSKMRPALLGMKWIVLESVGDFVLGDRPLARSGPLDNSFFCVLPLSPTAVFIASAPGNLRWTAKRDRLKLTHEVNKAQASQCDKYVFGRFDDCPVWLSHALRYRHDNPPDPIRWTFGGDQDS